MKLRVEDDGSSPQEFLLSDTQQNIVGRNPFAGATICIKDARLARRHFSLQCEDGIWWVEDLGSHCGIYVNHEIANARRSVVSSDTIHIGTLTFRLVP
jgi:pSer/pThr/pTyr-binding forkhead associated (FHA) protein